MQLAFPPEIEAFIQRQLKSGKYRNLMDLILTAIELLQKQDDIYRGRLLELCEAKSEKLGREFRVISRWEPTSQVCSECGFKWGKLDLSIRSILCYRCGQQQDRDENAAKNIEKVGIGHCHDSKRTRIDRKTTSVAG